jgi:hypothetical protein
MSQGSRNGAKRNALARRVARIDQRDDARRREALERPVDRRPRRFDGEAPAARVRGERPADFESRPSRRLQRADPAEKGAAHARLDDEHAEAAQFPVADELGDLVPAFTLAIRPAAAGDELRHFRIGQHRRIRGEILGAPFAQAEARRFDYRDFGRAGRHEG